jgi:hypothetical protein
VEGNAFGVMNGENNKLLYKKMGYLFFKSIMIFYIAWVEDRWFCIIQKFMENGLIGGLSACLSGRKLFFKSKLHINTPLIYLLNGLWENERILNQGGEVVLWRIFS